MVCGSLDRVEGSPNAETEGGGCRRGLAAQAEDNLHWLVNIDEGLINGVLFLDLNDKKAFDTVDHQTWFIWYN